ncbi:MAG: hypothetical protein ACOCWG_03800, partial [bacterium]
MLQNIFDPGVINKIDSDNLSKLEMECSSTINNSTELLFSQYELNKKYNTETIVTGNLLFYTNKKFRMDIERYPKFNQDLKEKAEKYFSFTIEKIGKINISNIICSLTDSDSIYFRIYKDNYTCH